MPSTDDEGLAGTRDALAAGRPLDALVICLLDVARTLRQIAGDVRDIRRQAMRGK